MSVFEHDDVPHAGRQMVFMIVGLCVAFGSVVFVESHRWIAALMLIAGLFLFFVRIDCWFFRDDKGKR